MDLNTFKSTLEQDGFGEIETKSYAGNLFYSVHSHPFDVRAQMLAGELTLVCEGQPHTYRTGEVFTMAAGCEHTEQFGAEGATYIVGRKRT